MKIIVIITSQFVLGSYFKKFSWFRPPECTRMKDFYWFPSKKFSTLLKKILRFRRPECTRMKDFYRFPSKNLSTWLKKILRFRPPECTRIKDFYWFLTKEFSTLLKKILRFRRPEFTRTKDFYWFPSKNLHLGWRKFSDLGLQNAPEWMTKDYRREIHQDKNPSTFSSTSPKIRVLSVHLAVHFSSQYK